MPELIHARTSCDESHMSTVDIYVGGNFSRMAQLAVKSSFVPTGSYCVIRVGVGGEGVRGSGRGGGHNCSTMSETPYDAAATPLAHCRHRCNFRATLSALQGGADKGTPTGEPDCVSVAARLDDIFGGYQDFW